MDTNCLDCNGSGDDPEKFFSCCRRCNGTGLASEEHCVRCGKRGPQCVPTRTVNARGEVTIGYCGID